MIKNITIAFLLFIPSLLVPSLGSAAGGNVKLDKVDIDLSDRASLQRGARIFVNYCLSCHSAAYMRYNRMGKDLGISDELVTDNLLFATDKVGDLMKAVMPEEDAKNAFGTVPPDLTLTARSRGPKWFYTYMRSFYRDESSASGWDNIVFPHVAMPHVLYEWQGEQRAVFNEVDGRKVFDHFEVAKAGSMDTATYDGAMRDLTNFMVYLGEPAKLVRYRIGTYVIIFLLLFLFVAYLLKKEFWKDIH
jgi:ubiquinol-cytochrome c reductase cytochrome c1 subunit